MKKAVYAGSFDPVTFGHLNVIRKAARLFDQVIVAVVDNPDKKTMFTSAKRAEFIREALKSSKHSEDFANVYVDIFKYQYTVNAAYLKEAKFLIRGVRNIEDFEYERNMYYINQEINENVETVFMLPDQEYQNLSSSVVKGLIGFAGWRERVQCKIPNCVFQDILKQRANAELEHVFASLEIRHTFADIVARYASEDRAYHNLDHIFDMLELFREKNALYQIVPKSHERIFEFAIWLHDYEHSIKGSDEENVDNSIMHAERLLNDSQFHGNSTIHQYVINLIKATNHSKIKLEDIHDRAMQLMHDLDWLSIGIDEYKFVGYETRIRKEYGKNITKQEYLEARIKFLEELADKEHILCLPEIQTQENAIKGLADWAAGKLNSELEQIKRISNKSV